jgi:hypothetical protein
MAIINYINTGSGANSGDGDSLRTAFTKINLNFDSLVSNFVAAGVTSWNGRVGVIDFTNADLLTLLGYTPYPNTNPDGFITSSTIALSNYARTDYVNTAFVFVSDLAAYNFASTNYVDLKLTEYPTLQYLDDQQYLTSINLSNFLTDYVTGGELATFGNTLRDFTTSTVFEAVNNNSIIPAQADIFNLGEESYRWSNLYLSNAVYIQGIGISVDPTTGKLLVDGNQITGGFNFDNAIISRSDQLSINITNNGAIQDSSALLRIPGPTTNDIDSTLLLNNGAAGVSLASGSTQLKVTGSGVSIIGNFSLPLKLKGEISTVTSQFTSSTLLTSGNDYIEITGNGWTTSPAADTIIPQTITSHATTNTFSPLNLKGSTVTLLSNTARDTTGQEPSPIGFSGVFGVSQQGVYIGLSDKEYSVPPGNDIDEFSGYKLPLTRGQQGQILAITSTSAALDTLDWVTPAGGAGLSLTALPSSLIPNANLAYDLGSTSSQWRSLYVGTSTIYLGGTALSVANGNITINGTPISGGGAGPVQAYLELTQSAFITQPVTLSTSTTVTASQRGQNALVEVVIGSGSVIESITVTTPGVLYVVGQRYRINYWQAGGNDDADNIDFEVGTVGSGGALLTIANAAFAGTATNVPGTYSEISSEYRPTVFDEVDDGLTLTRGLSSGFFNSEEEFSYNSSVSPIGTLWNAEGWGTLVGFNTRTYNSFDSILTGPDNTPPGELIMWDTINNKYYKFAINIWGIDNNEFSYTRTLITDPNYFKKTNGLQNGEIDIIKPLTAEAIGLETDYLEREEQFADIRDQDAISIAPETRPWDGLPSYQAYPLMTVYTPPNGVSPPSANLVTNAAVTRNAYLAWQEARSEAIGITRGLNNGIYNPYRETSYSDSHSPIGTLWNIDGWADLSNIESRTYTNLYDVYDAQLGGKIPGSKAVMYVPDIDKYYAIDWLSWTQGNQGGGFSYTRREIDLTKLDQGVRFADNTVQTTAYIPTNVVSTAPNERRIETASGYKQISVTQGGDSVVWWDKANLPGGSADFRGAIIDYHAYTESATIIGTIHIVDDDGEEYITHTEVSSGGTSSMNDNLWIVTNEGQIRYARFDGEARTLKIHWTAKVFYGNETYD